MSSTTPAHDHRTDHQILTSLQNCTPPSSSERSIWAFWDSGIAQSPPWCQRNVVSWVRRLGPTWTVRVLDMVDGSPSHYFKFLNSDLFPEALNKGIMEGPHLGQQRSDLIRLPLLTNTVVYGSTSAFSYSEAWTAFAGMFLKIQQRHMRWQVSQSRLQLKLA